MTIFCGLLILYQRGLFDMKKPMVNGLDSKVLKHDKIYSVPVL